MLKKLRNKKTAKKVWIVLAIIIVPAFMLWGLGGALRSQRESIYAGKIFRQKISALEYKDALDAVKNMAIIQFGDNLSEVQKYLNLESQAWERLILLTDAKKRKINVNDKEVVESIQKYPFFQRNGKFDRKIYSEILQFVFRTQPRIFEEQTRQNLMINKLYNTVTQSLNLTEEEIKNVYRKENEEVSIYYIASLYADFVKDIAATDEELKDYFAKNSLDFKQPLSFNLEYVSLESVDKIKMMFPRLNRKSNFAKIAADFGLSLKETGLFTQTEPIPGIGWSLEILNSIPEAKVGAFLPPIQVDKNYYILRLKERKEPHIPEFEAVKDKVKEVFIKDKSQGIAKEKIESCLKELQEAYLADPKNVDFDKTAKKYGLKSDATALFKYGSYIEGIGGSDIFWVNALKLKEDEFSQIIATPVGFYVIKFKQKVPVDEKKFEAEKTDFTQKVLLQKKQRFFSEFTEELKRKAQIFKPNLP